MALEVIGLGVGRTGTYSLKLALEQLGFGPCHHMEEVDGSSSAQLAFWSDAAAGRPVDWQKAYSGYRSAVDWPTAAFCDELLVAYPRAKFLLTVRDRAAWYESFSRTIGALVDPAGTAPQLLQPFNAMVRGVLKKTGLDVTSGRDALLTAFDSHVAHVTGSVPSDRLLVFEVTDGWDLLCRFLGVPVPDTPFPRTNSAREFWESVGADIMKPPVAV